MDGYFIPLCETNWWHYFNVRFFFIDVHIRKNSHTWFCQYSQRGKDSLSMVLSSVNVFPLGGDKTYDQCGHCNAIATVSSLGSSEDTDSVEV